MKRSGDGRMRRGWEAPMDIDSKQSANSQSGPYKSIFTQDYSIFEESSLASSPQTTLKTADCKMEDDKMALDSEPPEPINIEPIEPTELIEPVIDDCKEMTRKIEHSNHIVDNYEMDICKVDGNVDGIEKSVRVKWMGEILKYVINVPMLLFTVICAMVYHDFSLKYSHLLSSKLLEQDSCAQQYAINRCLPTTRVPALDKVCKEWEVCMNSPLEVSRWRVLAECMAEVIEGFVGNVSYKSIVLISLLLLHLLACN
jgi:hypothetical protein